VRRLAVSKLWDMSIPVLDKFAKVESKPWDRKAVVLELLGELGSLAHEIQYWDGYKKRVSHKSKLCDECSDVLLIVIRLAREDNIALPAEIAFDEPASRRATDLVLEMYALFSKLINPDNENELHTVNSLHAMTEILQTLGSLSLLADFDLFEAHKMEMAIADGFFEASGDDWPKPNIIRHPIKTFRLYRLVKRRRPL